MKTLLEQTFSQVNIGILVVDKQYIITLCNDFITNHTQQDNTEIVGSYLFNTFPTLPKKWLQRRIDSIVLLKNSSFISWEQRPSLFDFASSRPITGINEKMIQNCTLFPILDDENQVSHICITVTDATATAVTQLRLKQISNRLNKEKKEQQRLIDKLEETKNQLLQSEKMASIGQLAAGVAHEINNPVGFIKSNFASLKSYAEDINSAIGKYNDIIRTLENEVVYESVDNINNEHDVEFVLEDITSLLTESFDGISRIEDIVKSLKHFSRADTNQWEKTDINQGIEETLKVVAHELKYIAEVEKNFGELPPVECLPMQVNQVLVNLLVNAGQAIGPDKSDGKITITTQHKNQYVAIVISDNGKGINEENLVKIFDPFFTTKAVGQGTGLGLSLSYNIIKKHSGDITVESALGKGTSFTISLPITQNADDELDS
ncbi:GHKL domain-containing protein [Alteromonadaceae bacterium M269]|nr:GHKL domain-containing protein [Alteromonadaceae bacterium M269]